MAITDTLILPSGREVRVQMPDLYAILASVGGIPSQLIIDAVNLLTAERVYKPAPVNAEASALTRQIVYLRGVYAICSLCLVEPRLVLDGEPGEGEIGIADLTWGDAEVVYFGFFRGFAWAAPPRLAASAAPDDARATESGAAGDDVGA